MAKYSGNGGYIKVAAAGGSRARFEVVKWDGDWKSRLAETTDSASAGASRYQHVVQDNSATVEFIWDSAAGPEAAGIAVGGLVDCDFVMGTSTKGYTLTNAAVESLQPSDDNTSDVIRFKANLKGGSLAGPSTIS